MSVRVEDAHVGLKTATSETKNNLLNNFSNEVFWRRVPHLVFCFSRREPPGFCLEVFCRRTFLDPGKRHISASSEGRIGPNSRVGAPPLSSRLRGPPRNRKSSGGIFLRCCYTIPEASKQASKQAKYCLIAPPLDLTYLILSRT